MAGRRLPRSFYPTSFIFGFFQDPIYNRMNSNHVPNVRSLLPTTRKETISAGDTPAFGACELPSERDTVFGLGGSSSDLIEHPTGRTVEHAR